MGQYYKCSYHSRFGYLINFHSVYLCNMNKTPMVLLQMTRLYHQLFKIGLLIKMRSRGIWLVCHSFKNKRSNRDKVVEKTSPLQKLRVSM